MMYTGMVIHTCMGTFQDLLTTQKDNVEMKIVIFVETINDKERFMSRIVKLYVCLVAVHNLFVKDELPVDYCFSRFILIQKQIQAVGLPLEVKWDERGRKKMAQYSFSTLRVCIDNLY